MDSCVGVDLTVPPDSVNEDKETKKGNLRKRYKQTAVLLTILGLTLCSETSTLSKWEDVTTLLGAPVLLLLLTLTKFKGRIPLFITLFSISIISSITYLIGYQTQGETVQAIVQEATTALTAVTICEYCDPKHRFAYLIVNFAIQRVTFLVTVRCVQEYSECDKYLQYIKIAIGLAGGGSVLTWPESPYWLASKRRFDESRRAFSSIRSESPQSDDELRAMMEARRGSAKMLYVPVLIAVPLLITAKQLGLIEKSIFYDYIGFNGHDIWVYTVLQGICTVATIQVAAKMTRRALFLLSSLLFLTLFLVDTCLEPLYLDYIREELVFVASSSILYAAMVCGPVTLSYPIFLEIVPQRYFTATTASISMLFYIVSFLNYILIEDLLFHAILPVVYFCILLSLITCYFLLPEAKNKSLVEIEQLYLLKIEHNQQHTDTYF